MKEERMKGKAVISTTEVLGFWVSFWQVLKGARILADPKCSCNNPNSLDHQISSEHISRVVNPDIPDELQARYQELEAMCENYQYQGKPEK